MNGFYLVLRINGCREEFDSIFELRDSEIEFFTLNAQTDGLNVINNYLLDGTVTEGGTRSIYPINMGSEQSIENLVFSSCPYYTKLDQNELKKYKIVKSILNSAEYYPMIYRPILNFGSFKHGIVDINHDNYNLGTYPLFIENSLTLDQKLTQYELILDDLANLFKYVEPSQNNYQTYGHSIRNLIILACTEVENLFQSFLKGHNYHKKRNCTMKDYKEANKYLRLHLAYAFFPRYTKLKLIRPFESWSSENASLPWYKAYNDIKHDREANYKSATLENAILCVSAVGIILAMMYGQNNSYWNEKAGKFIIVENEPFSISEYYIPPKFIKGYAEKWTQKTLWE